MYQPVIIMVFPYFYRKHSMPKTITKKVVKKIIQIIYKCFFLSKNLCCTCGSITAAIKLQFIFNSDVIFDCGL